MIIKINCSVKGVIWVFFLPLWQELPQSIDLVALVLHNLSNGEVWNVAFLVNLIHDVNIRFGLLYVSWLDQPPGDRALSPDHS